MFMQYWPVEGEEIALFCQTKKFADLASFNFCLKEYWFDWSPIIFIILASIAIIFLNERQKTYTKFFVAGNLIVYLIYISSGTITYINYFGFFSFLTNYIIAFLLLVPFLLIANIILLRGLYSPKSLNLRYAIYIFLAWIQIGWNAGLRAA